MTVNIKNSEIQQHSIREMLERHLFSEESINTIVEENLLPYELLMRLHIGYTQYSGFFRTDRSYFKEKTQYSGLKGFREIIEILKENGVEIDNIKEREFFIEVYRFLATKHILNSIDWQNYEKDSLYHLVFPQAGMMEQTYVQKYINAKTDEERKRIVQEYRIKTNPHDGKQKLNKPWFINDDNKLEILDGCQHKYPPILLILDKYTQNCFAYCTYCFRHAQVRGDEDMFVQQDISQVLNYIKRHKEISDILITGGDAGFITYERLAEYAIPLLEDPELIHVKTLRIGSRVATYHPELLLSKKYKEILELLKRLTDSGVQAVWVSHFSTPRELLNPGTVAAIRRLKNHGINVKSQSPIMRHISMFSDDNGKIDVDKSAKNWIDLGNILGILGIGFHSMYCPRPTGEHHYFSAPLADIIKIFNKVFKELASMYRPSRYITMTFSSGKISMIGTTEINNEKVFVFKFNESRNMNWMDEIFFAEYDDKENTIEKLKPYKAEKFFYQDELKEIERMLEETLKAKIIIQ